MATGKMDFDETWGYSHFTAGQTAPSDTGRVCDWSNVTGSELPHCSIGTCEGHRIDDVLPFVGLVSDGDTYTNKEFYTFTHPYNEDLPYVYDSFEWSHCAAQGYVMN